MCGIPCGRWRLAEDCAPHGDTLSGCKRHLGCKEQASACGSSPPGLDAQPPCLRLEQDVEVVEDGAVGQGRARGAHETGKRRVGDDRPREHDQILSRGHRSDTETARIGEVGVIHAHRRRCGVEACDESRTVARDPHREGLGDVVRRWQQERQQQVALGEDLAGTYREVRPTCGERLSVQEHIRVGHRRSTVRVRRVPRDARRERRARSWPWRPSRSAAPLRELESQQSRSCWSRARSSHPRAWVWWAARPRRAARRRAPGC